MTTIDNLLTDNKGENMKRQRQPAASAASHLLLNIAGGVATSAGMEAAVIWGMAAAEADGNEPAFLAILAEEAETNPDRRVRVLLQEVVGLFEEATP